MLMLAQVSSTGKEQTPLEQVNSLGEWFQTRPLDSRLQTRSPTPPLPHRLTSDGQARTSRVSFHIREMDTDNTMRGACDNTARDANKGSTRSLEHAHKKIKMHGLMVPIHT